MPSATTSSSSGSEKTRYPLPAQPTALMRLAGDGNEDNHCDHRVDRLKPDAVGVSPGIRPGSARGARPGARQRLPVPAAGTGREIEDSPNERSGRAGAPAQFLQPHLLGFGTAAPPLKDLGHFPRDRGLALAE